MKKCFGFLVFLVAISLSVSWMLAGCKGVIPPLAIMVPTVAPTLQPGVVSDFSNLALNMNPNLKNSLNGYWFNGTYGQTTMSMVVTAPVPADGNAAALHLFGTFTDPGNGSYPAFQLQGFPRNNSSFFNASSFTGIKFDWNCPNGDNTVQRFFCLAIARTTPSSQGGNCTGAAGAVPCYDHFSSVLPMTNGLWTTRTIPFAALALQYNAGAPNTIQPADLQQIVFLMWTNRANNVAGNYGVDMWLDNVNFY